MHCRIQINFLSSIQFRDAFTHYTRLLYVTNPLLIPTPMFLLTKDSFFIAMYYIMLLLKDKIKTYNKKIHITEVQHVYLYHVQNLDKWKETWRFCPLDPVGYDLPSHSCKCISGLLRATSLYVFSFLFHMGLIIIS